MRTPKKAPRSEVSLNAFAARDNQQRISYSLSETSAATEQPTSLIHPLGSEASVAQNVYRAPPQATIRIESVSRPQLGDSEISDTLSTSDCTVDDSGDSRNTIFASSLFDGQEIDQEINQEISPRWIK